LHKKYESKDFSHLGIKGRFRKIPSKTLVDSAFTHELKTATCFHEGIGMADMAHVSMLVKKRIIAADAGIALLKELLVLQQKNIAELNYSSEYGDLYNNRDRYLSGKLGSVSGHLHTGRPRREATNIAFLIACRELVALLGAETTNLCGTLLNAISAHKYTYMTDFTYLHHAQPTTLAHYLLGFLYSYIRDIERLKTVYIKLNQSPAGSGSVNGSRLNLDREYLRRLLGFDSHTEHARDSMWRADMPVETISAVMILVSNISRLAEELQIWTTIEFDFFDLAEEHSRTSVIMPQKKNPYSLAFIRGVARNMLGKLTAIAAAGQTPSGQPDNRIFIYVDLPESLETAIKTVRLFEDILKKGRFNKKNLLNSVQTGFPVATDIVDFLTVSCGLDNRSAHSVIGLVAREINKQNYRAVTPDMIYAAGNKLGVRIKKFNEEDFYRLLDLKSLIECRRTRGGASAGSVNDMIKDCRSRVISYRTFFKQRDHNKFKKAFYRKIERFIRSYQ
jgi:argininosuccinate lyase